MVSKDEFIDSRVSEHQCQLAVEALHSHESKKEQKRQENELLPGKEQNVWIMVTVKKIHPSHKIKPVKIPIVHPLVDPRTTPVCLITKDPQRQYKDLLESHGIKFISRVVGIEKLKGKFKPYEARRMLLKENGMFLADDRIIPLLPRLLGSKWFQAKKQPIPVCLTRKDLKGELERAISSTYMNQNNGSCTAIKIGLLSQKPSKVLANIKSALPVIAKNIKGGWDNIQSLYIKTNSSVSLPIWSCSLDATEGGRWFGLGVASNEEMRDSEEEDDGVDIDNVKDAEKETAGTKRASKNQGEKDGAENPKKKAIDAKEKHISEAPKNEAPVKGVPPAISSSATKHGKFASADIDGVSKTKKRKASSVSGSEPTISQPPPSSTPEQSQKSSTTTPSGTAADPSPVKKPRNLKTKTLITTGNPAHQTSEIKAQPASDPSPSKKKKPRPSEAVQTTALSQVTQDVDEVRADSPQKKKGSGPSVAADPPALGSKDTPTTDGPPSKKSKKDKATPISTLPASASSSSPVLVANDERGDQEKKAKRKDREGKRAGEKLADSNPADVTLSKAELKMKRVAGAGEKKKDKVVKAKGGRSAKDGIIGKKVAQG